MFKMTEICLLQDFFRRNQKLLLWFKFLLVRVSVTYRKTPGHCYRTIEVGQSAASLDLPMEVGHRAVSLDIGVGQRTASEIYGSWSEGSILGAQMRSREVCLRCLGMKEVIPGSSPT